MLATVLMWKRSSDVDRSKSILVESVNIASYDVEIAKHRAETGRGIDAVDYRHALDKLDRAKEHAHEQDLTNDEIRVAVDRGRQSSWSRTR